MILYSAPPSYYSMIGRLALNAAQISFENHHMDIHVRKEQLAPWYIALNPHMTVPTLVDGKTILIDSQDILRVLIPLGYAESFAKRAIAVVGAGRAPCPFCGGPIDPSGHLCPRANGYRR